MVMASILSLVIISVSYHAYHTNVKWKKRRDEEINAEIARNKRQSIQMQEGYKLVKEDKLQLNGINMEMKSLCKQPLPVVRFYTPADEDNESLKGKELRIEPRLKHSAIRGYLNKIDKTWEPIEETSEILEEITEDK
ncbi:neurexin-4 [Aphis craccivora]|uniref:Neurexin-4 n=1 Tax=Aphis craccivora TaxID=307492 RepID=A0A6G0YB35_APHCR|nr:neurexin-4 [Aphis craccivora]